MQGKGAHGVEVTADEAIDNIEVDIKDWLILPGGMPGATNLAACEKLCEMLQAHNENGGHIAAICASPAVVLAPLGIIEGKEATCYPGFESHLEGASVSMNPVEVAGNVITSRGMGTAIEFGLAIVEKMTDVQTAKDLSEKIIYK